MILLGVILIVIGLLAGIGLLFDLGVLLAIIGVVLLLVGLGGGSLGGRRYWY